MSNSHNDKPIFYSGKAASDYLGIEISSMSQAHKRGNIEAAAYYMAKTGLVPLFTRESLDAYQGNHPKSATRIMRETLEKLAADGNEDAKSALDAMAKGRRKKIA